MSGRIRFTATALLVVVSVFGFLGSTSPAAAEQPSLVVRALQRDGVFIHTRRDDGVDRDALVQVIEDADRLGYKMAVVIPLEPLPELRSFVLRVQQGGEFDVVLGFGLEDQIEAEVGDELGGERLSALRAVRNTSGPPEDLAALFLTELTTEPEPTIPEAVWQVIRWVAYLLAALVIAGIIETIYRKFSRRGRPNPTPAEPIANESTTGEPVPSEPASN